MIKISGKRASGKTTAIVELCKKNNGILITNNYWSKQHCIECLGLDSKNVFTIYDVLKNRIKGRNQDIFIDILSSAVIGICKRNLYPTGKIRAITINE